MPAAGQQPKIVLRNTGGQVANLTGWRLFAGENSTAGGGQILYIGDNARCRPNATLPSGQSLVLSPRSDTNPCGVPFNLSERCVCVLLSVCGLVGQASACGER